MARGESFSQNFQNPNFSLGWAFPLCQRSRWRALFVCARCVLSHSWGLLTKKKAPLALEMRYFQRSTHSEETLWRLLCACGQSQQQLTEMRARAAGGAAAGPRMVGSLRLQGLGPFCEAACHHWPHHLRMSCRHIP